MSEDGILTYFSLIFPRKQALKFDENVTICTKCQSLFSGQNKKNINLSSAKFAQKVVKVKITRAKRYPPLLLLKYDKICEIYFDVL